MVGNTKRAVNWFNSLVANLELSKLTRRGRPSCGTIEYERCQPRFQVLQKSVQFARFALGDQLDRAIGQILHISTHGKPLGSPAARIAESDALDASAVVYGPTLLCRLSFSHTLVATEKG